MVSHFVLAVMGVTGAGKSSFIKLATGDNRIKVGHSQLSETKEIGSYDVYIRGSRFTIVDTPGFDDDNLSDCDVLKLLIDWLASTYRTGKKLNGILYLHRITDTRMRGSSHRNLKMFKELIGDDFHANVTLGTTCWSLVAFQTAVDRETELKTSTAFWKTLISKGARLERIPESATAARDLIYQIASNDAIVLPPQRDIVDLGKSFSSLKVAKLVDNDLEKLRKQHEAEMQTLREAEQAKRAYQERERQAEWARQQLEREEELKQITERNERIRKFKSKQASCSRIQPRGSCDKCHLDTLQRHKIIYHCCSCRSHDMYWHCAPCGSNCGEDDHPVMTQIDNDGCLIM